MSWKPMDTAPKDRVIVVYAEIQVEKHARVRPDVLLAHYATDENRFVFFSDLEVDRLAKEGKVRSRVWTDLPEGSVFIGRGSKKMAIVMTTLRLNAAQRNIHIPLDKS